MNPRVDVSRNITHLWRERAKESSGQILEKPEEPLENV
jgi:hypothetical protein